MIIESKRGGKVGINVEVSKGVFKKIEFVAGENTITDEQRDLLEKSSYYNAFLESGIFVIDYKELMLKEKPKKSAGKIYAKQVAV